MNNLKPCPFCGGGARLSQRQMRFFGQNYIGQKKIKYGEQVICGRCHARGTLFSRIVIFPSKDHQAAFRWLEESAAEAWNRRASDAVPEV